VEEQVYLVDENDKVIGKKNRKDLEAGDCWRIVSIWIFNKHGQLLIAQRTKQKAYNPSVWGPSASGTVEYGDDYHETAKRELEEEIGLSGIDLKRIGKQHYRSGDTYRMCEVYVGLNSEPAEKFKLQTEEVYAVRWITSSALKQEYTRHPENFILNMANLFEYAVVNAGPEYGIAN